MKLLKKNGFIYYELLISLIMLSTLIYFLISPINQLIINLDNQKLTYEMKQTLSLNILLN